MVCRVYALQPTVSHSQQVELLPGKYLQMEYQSIDSFQEAFHIGKIASASTNTWPADCTA